MKKIALIFIAILLSGCVVDTSATQGVKIDLSFQFNEDEVYIDIKRKAVGDYFLNGVYSIYTSSEQAAYLLSGSNQFSVKLNDVQIDNIVFKIGEKIETMNDTIYELTFDLSMMLFSEQFEQLDTSITSLIISYKDIEIINFKHSPIFIKHDFYRFVIEGGYKDHPDEVSGLGLKNNTTEDLSIKQLFVEGINNERFVIRDEPIVFKPNDIIKLSINRKLFEQHAIEGVVGIYALLENGRELFLTDAPFTIENYKEKRIEKLIESIENK